MKRLLIIGAGAIGRGFLPWAFPPEEYQYWFRDTNQWVINRLKRSGVMIYLARKDGYHLQKIHGQDAPPPEFDAVFTAVGPRNFLSLADEFKGTKVPVICCENDSRLPKIMRDLTGNPNICFGIPDVIVSNSAPKKLKDIDPAAVVTEDGVCYIEDTLSDLGGRKVEYLSKEGMRREWIAKLYIHNTPHCIAAYLGYQKNKLYVHNAMAEKEIYKIVEGAMNETSQMVVKCYGIDPDFADRYAKKELARFSNELLCDPISRVAREPLRKLAKDDRLIGAAAICLQYGVYPKNILLGIKAALRYINMRDPDYRLMKQIGPMDKFLDYIGVTPKEPIYDVIIKEVK